MKNSKYEFDGKDLTVRSTTMKLVAKGDWLRLYVKEPKFGWIQSFSVDSNGAKNFFNLVASFLEAVKAVHKEAQKIDKKKSS